MHDPGLVGRRQRVCDLRSELDRPRRFHAGRRDHVRQRMASHVLHGDEVDAVRHVDVVNRDDVGVIQCRGGLGLERKAPLAL